MSEPMTPEERSIRSKANLAVLTWLEAVEDERDTLTTQLAEMTRERDEAWAETNRHVELLRRTLDRALAAEQRVKELEGVVDAARADHFTPKGAMPTTCACCRPNCPMLLATAALTGTEPREGT